MLKKKTTTLIILLIIKSIIPECGKNCSICSPENTCRLCDITKSFILKENTCKYGVIDFCNYLTISGLCLSCAKNSFLDPTTVKCVKIEKEKEIPNCYYYQTAVSCITCEPGHYLKGGGCSKIDIPIANCEFYSPLDGLLCKGCQDGFILSEDFKECMVKVQSETCSNFNFSRCKTCKDGFVSNENNYLLEYFSFSNEVESQGVMDFVLDLKLTNGFGKCVRIEVENCEVFKDYQNCDECVLGYFKNDLNLCVLNPLDGIPNCNKYKSQLKCDECIEGYHLKSEAQCYKNGLIEKCIEFSQVSNKTLCTRCDTGYYLKEENICKQRAKEIFNCEIYNPIEETCQKCKEYFILSKDIINCFETITDCQIHEENSEKTGLNCTKCVDGYFWSNDLNKCTRGNKDLNCAVFANPESCQICKEEYFLDGDVCKQHEVITSCINYNKVISNKCDVCNTNTILFQYKNYCASITEIENCKIYFDENSCDVCKDGFYYVTPKICSTIPPEENCLQRDKQTLKCNKCRIDYFLVDGICKSLKTYKSVNCAKDNRDGVLLLKEFICDYCKENFFPNKIIDTFMCFREEIIEDKIVNCNKYKSDFDCLECKDPYVLTGNTCESACPNGSALILRKIEVDATHIKIISRNFCETNADNCQTLAPNIHTQSTTPLYSCVECINGFFKVPVLNKFVNFYYDTDGSIYGGEDNGLVVYPEVSCVSENEAGKTIHLIENCEFYYLYDTDKYGCMKCSFGFRGQVTSPTDIYFNTCTSMSSVCDINTKYQGFQLTKTSLVGTKYPLPIFFSCHKCVGSSVPTVFITIKDTNWSIAKNHLTGGVYSIECLQITHSNFGIEQSKFNFMDTSEIYTPSQHSRCALIVIDTRYTDATESNIESPDMTKAGVYCAACKPKFKSFKTDDLSNFMIWKCAEINNCQASNWLNSCSQCENGFVWGYNDTDKVILFDECLSNDILNCSVGLLDGVCIYCKKGYFLNVIGKCELIKAPFCQDNSLDPFISFSYTDVGGFFSGNFSILNKGQGCHSCENGYFPVKVDTPEYVCSSNSFVDLKNDFDNVFYLVNCKLYGILADNSVFCQECDQDYILTSSSKCVLKTEYPDCEIPNDSNACETCETGFYLEGVGCSPGGLSNCLIYQTQTACRICGNTFYVKDGECLPGAIHDCLEYSSKNTCIKCKDGFIILLDANAGSICFPIETEKNCAQYDLNEYNNNELNCLNCNEGLILLNSGNFQKSKCQNTKILDSCLNYDVKDTLLLSTLDCIECELLYFIDNTTRTCSLRTYKSSDCEKFILDKDECETCKLGYFLNPEKQCTKNPDGINNCRVYKNQTICLLCQAGYFIEENFCAEVQIKIANCLWYEKEEKCIECQETHFLSENSCLLGTANNCLGFKSPSECLKCKDTYGFSPDENNNPICIEKTILNCFETQLDDVKKCKICNENFFVNSDICDDVTSAIENCKFYLSADQCAQCKEGFTLSLDYITCIGNSTLILVDPNCDDNVINSSLLCDGCKKEHYLDRGECKICENFTMEKGCFYCDSNDEKCLMCATGYYMVANQTCVEWVEPVVEDPVTPPTNSTETEGDVLEEFEGIFFVAIINFLVFS